MPIPTSLAAERFMKRPASRLGWGQRIEFPGVMDLIEVDEAVAKFEAFRAHRGV